MLYVLCLDIYWLWSHLISSCATLLLRPQWPCSSSSMVDLTEHRALAMLFPLTVMFCLEIGTEWIFFFFPLQNFSQWETAIYLIKVYYYSSPSITSTIQSWSPSPTLFFLMGLIIFPNTIICTYLLCLLFAFFTKA